MRLAIVGCGAISERYGKVLARRDIRRVVAVDLEAEAARAFAAQNRFERSATDYRSVFGDIDCAIVCLPNNLHGPVAIDMLRHGVAVLCEKPMAVSSAEAAEMVAAARQTGQTLAVANVRRFYWSSRRIKQMFETNEFGRPLSIEAEEGLVFGWKTRSGFFFDKKRAGGGVTTDIGSHAVDMILWWLHDYPQAVQYRDDDCGGVEADAEAQFSFRNGLSVMLRLSWLRQLSNVYRVEFERETAWYWPHDYNRIALGRNARARESLRAPSWLSSEQCFGLMVDDFLESVRHRRAAFVPGEEAEPSIRLIAQCYGTRMRLELPWMTPRKKERNHVHGQY